MEVLIRFIMERVSPVIDAFAFFLEAEAEHKLAHAAYIVKQADWYWAVSTPILVLPIIGGLFLIVFPCLNRACEGRWLWQKGPC